MYLYHVMIHMRDCPRGNRVKDGVECKWTGCNSKYPSLYKLRDHMRCHTKEKIVACPDCGVTFASKAKFHAHCQRQIPLEGNEFIVRSRFPSFALFLKPHDEFCSAGIPLFTLQQVLPDRRHLARSHEIPRVQLQMHPVRHELRITGEPGETRPVPSHVDQNVFVSAVLVRCQVAAGSRFSHDCPYEWAEFLLPLRGMPLHLQGSLLLG